MKNTLVLFFLVTLVLGVHAQKNCNYFAAYHIKTSANRFTQKTSGQIYNKIYSDTSNLLFGVRSLDTLIYYPNQKNITIKLIQNDSINCFVNSGNVDDWQFYYFHGIYNLFFSYSNITSITIFLNNSPYTCLPIKGDIDNILLPKNKMFKKWYKSCLDYYSYFKSENLRYYEKAKPRIANASYLNRIFSKAKPK